jgi:hypothetical protein
VENILLTAAVPAAVVLSFLVHWLSLVPLRSSAQRLPYCRGAYMAFSLQLLLYGWLLYALLARGNALLVFIPLGMTCSSLGDFFNLQFEPAQKWSKEPLFFGILAFMAAQLCYTGGLLQLADWRLLATRGYLWPLVAALVILPALLFRLRVYNPERPARIMVAALVYGAILGCMAAVCLAAAIALGGWWFVVAAGALFFLLSDAIMGETTVYGRHPIHEYQLPWWTYLLAQGLILFGSAMLYA